ncbi:hypothetical protein AAG570_012302 [Ranatra chinensis]|uniref:Uncharacterized protein n=1 Tax=Ranatra chinensis TaxID=642074 RepID=A0ABD0YIM7_9HEMI
MYDSCPYGGGLELKRCSIKSEELAAAAQVAGAGDWYRFCNPSTFQQLKQSVEKAKAALTASSAFTDLSTTFQSPRSDDERRNNGKKDIRLFHIQQNYVGVYLITKLNIRITGNR